MKVAVTGATGFLGRHVVAELTERAIPACLVVRPDASAAPELARHRIARLDLRNAPADAFEQLGKPDVVIHLAWGGLPNYRSLHHFEEELPAQYAFLKRLVEGGLEHLVVTGSCLEYGLQSGPLGAELPTRPVTPYGLAKDVLRRQLQFLQQVRKFNLTWARLFYLYGDGQAATSLLSQLKAAVAEGLPAFNMSRGEQLRDYLPVTEVAKRLVNLALERRDRGVLNVCSGVPVSVRSLVEGWIKENGWNIALNLGYYPYPDYEPLAFWGASDPKNGTQP